MPVSLLQLLAVGYQLLKSGYFVIIEHQLRQKCLNANDTVEV